MSLVRSTLFGGDVSGHNSLVQIRRFDQNTSVIKLDQGRKRQVQFQEAQESHGEYIYSMVIMGDSNEDKSKLIQNLTGENNSNYDFFHFMLPVDK